MDTKTILSALAFIAFAAVYFYYCWKKKQEIYDRLAALEKENKYQEAYDLANSRWSRFLMTRFDNCTKILSYAMETGAKEQIVDAFERFKRVRTMTPTQEVRLAARAFDYYLSIDDPDRIEYYYKKLMDIGDEAFTKEIDCIYNTYYQGGYVYLDYKLEQLKHLQPQYRATNEFYISKMYENKGDLKNAEKYLERALKHTESMALESQLIKKSAGKVNARKIKYAEEAVEEEAAIEEAEKEIEEEKEEKGSE